MRRVWASAMVAAAVWAAAAPARGQELMLQSPQFYDPAAAGVQYVIEPTDTVLLGADTRGAGPATRDVLHAAAAGGVRTQVNGQTVQNATDVSVGFTYLIPLWTYRDFQLAAPRGYESAFPVFGSSGHVDGQFAYAPRVNLNYRIDDLDLDVGTSGTFLNLSGRVDRQARTRAAGFGQLLANSNLTLVSANLIEFGRTYAFADLFPRKNPTHDEVADSTVSVRIGSRYISVDQNYTGTLVGGPTGQNVTTRYSTQTFRGLGLTGAAEWTGPDDASWGPYLSVRQSVLLGENRRNSSVSVNAANLPPLADTQYDNNPKLVPVTELELGFDVRLRGFARLRGAEEEKPRFKIRTAVVGQYWGGLGPLSAASDQGFRETDLFLVGGYVQAGFGF